MSAWLVSNGHIDVLVNALAAQKIIEGSEAKQVGQMLWDENAHSLEVRYGDLYDPETRTLHYRGGDREELNYVLHTTEASLDPYSVYKAIACYEYQSCEHPGWEDSMACSLMRKLITVLEHQLGGSDFIARGHARYDNAPWRFVSLEQALIKEDERA